MSIYQSSSLGTANNLINFNDFTASPVYRIQSRQPQRRQLRELDIPVPFESGIADFETLVGQTAYVIDGTMYPGSENEYDLGLQKLRKLASLDYQQSDNLSDNGYVPYTWAEFSKSKTLFVKVLYVQIMESTRQGLVQPFRLICKVKDPTIFGASLKTATTATADPTGGTGSFKFPVKYPAAYGASTYSVTSNANNEGDISVYPVGINIYGPCSNPRITNTTTGEYIELTATTLSSASNVLRIAYDKDTIRIELDGVNVLAQVTNTSTLFKLRPGGNVITLTGASVSAGAYAEVVYRDGYPLS